MLCRSLEVSIDDQGPPTGNAINWTVISRCRNLGGLMINILCDSCLTELAGLPPQTLVFANIVLLWITMKPSRESLRPFAEEDYPTPLNASDRAYPGLSFPQLFVFNFQGGDEELKHFSAKAERGLIWFKNVLAADIRLYGRSSVMSLFVPRVLVPNVRFLEIGYGSYKDGVDPAPDRPEAEEWVVSA